MSSARAARIGRPGPTRSEGGSGAAPRKRLQPREGASAGRRIADEILKDSGRLGPAVRRRWARRALRAVPAFTIAAAAAVCVDGGFARARPRAAEVAFLVLLGGCTAWASAAALARSRTGRRATGWQQLELGALWVVLTAAVASLSAPVRSGEAPLFPLVYLAVAVSVAFMPRAVGLCVVALSAALQLGEFWVRGAPHADLTRTLARVGFTLLFAVLYHAVLWARLAAAGRAEREAVDRRLREIDERAREMRLLTPVSHEEGGDDEERAQQRSRSAVVEMESAIRGALEVAEVALRSHTCALFQLSDDDRSLRLRECRSRSDQVARRDVPAGEGVLGSVIARGAPVRLQGEIRTASYYDDGTRPRAILAVPLVDRRGRHVRGVLLADRLDDAPFTDGDEEVLVRVAGELIRALASERILVDLARARDEKELFYSAIDRLNRTSTTREVLEAALDTAIHAVAKGKAVSFAAVTLVADRPRHHVARAVTVEGGERIPWEHEGRRFGDNSGLVASAIRLGSTLPGKEIDLSSAMIFDDVARLRGLESLRIFPLKAGDKVQGTLVLGSRSGDAFKLDSTRKLEVIAMQTAAALVRASLFEQNERLATSDGLTGLANHRTFQARLDEQLAIAHRYGKPLSVVLCDVDHFKAVNDTHGHPVGDEVLKGTARELARVARATDVVARYGGEEFALVMPETDVAGAQVIAERIRARVAEKVFATELGPLRITVSLGVASFPAHARTKARLVELADACLYQAKRGGRNRVVAAAPEAARS